MNKDDMTDDAEFAAFLKGEGELSRRLQAMPQPTPSAALDASILARARADMAREQRPPAANDPGEAPVTPRLAPSFGERFRIPMGIAATLLAGVFANQAFNKSDPLRGQIVEEDNLPQAVIVSPIETPSAAALPAAAPAPVPVAEQPMLPKVAMDQAAAADRQMAALSEEKRARSAEEESSLQKRRAMPAMRGGAASQAKELQFPAAASPVSAAAPPPAMEVPPAPPAPAPQVDAYSRSQGARAKPAPVPAELTRVEVTGSSVKRIAPLTPEQWLAHIGDLLDAGLNNLALEEWKKFRAAHPGVKVEPALEAKLEALRKE